MAAQVPYITPDELVARSINAPAISTFSLAQKQAAILSASALIDSYLRSKFTFPIIAWGEDIKQACADIAAYRLLSVRGFNPAAPGDTNVRLKFEDVINWLKDIARGYAPPDVTDSSGTEAAQEAPEVISGTSRGFSSRGLSPKPGGDFVGD